MATLVITRNPVLAGMVAGAVAGAFDGGPRGAVVGAAIGAITGGVGASDAIQPIARSVIGMGMGALLGHATNAMADGGGGSTAGNSGGGYNGPLFPSGVSPGGGYSAISGTTHDFVGGYSANVVSNGHVFHGAFYQAIGKICSGISMAIDKGVKAAGYFLKRAFYTEWVDNSTLRGGTIEGFVRAGKVAVLSHTYTTVHVAAFYALANTPVSLLPSLINDKAITLFDGIGPGPPNSAWGVVANRVIRLNEWALSPPPWE